MDSPKEQEFLRQNERGLLLSELKKDPDQYDIWISTGSSAGSLPGFVVEKGLVPTGWMLSGKSKAVAYSGELSKGVGERGINQEAVSFANPDGRSEEALRYAKGERFNQKGWTPEIGKEEKEQLIKRLSEWSVVEDGHQKYGHQSVTDWIKLQLLIINRRLEEWDNFLPQEQQFIRQPFPLIYGINYRDKQAFGSRLTKPRVGDGEVAIKGRVDAGKLTLFCPIEKVLEVKDYLKTKGVEGTTILPLEVFSFLVNLWWWQSQSKGDEYQMNYEERIKKELDWLGFNKRFPTIHSFVDALRRWEVKSPVPI